MPSKLVFCPPPPACLSLIIAVKYRMFLLKRFLHVHSVFTWVLRRFDFKTMIVALMMEVVGTSETPVYIYETTRHHIPEGCYLHTRRDNLRSHILYVLGIHVEEYTAARS
jgi:hypothetical protein